MSTDESQTAAHTKPADPQPAAGTSAADAQAPLRTGHMATQLPAWNLEPPRTLLARRHGE